MSDPFTTATRSAEEMIAAGHQLAASLKAGDIIALTGGLGAGKTHFSKGIVAGLGAEEEVTSPTFSLVQEYLSGRVPVFHFDFYRLNSEQELLALGWDDYLDENGIIIAEWADKFPGLLPDSTIFIDIHIGSDGSHTLRKT